MGHTLEVINVTEHIPSFISGYSPNRCAIDNDPDELLAIPWLQKWRENDDPGMAFHRWSVSHDQGDRWYLMAEFAEGRRWYVAAILVGKVEELGLPTWQKTEK